MYSNSSLIWLSVGRGVAIFAALWCALCTTVSGCGEGAPVARDAHGHHPTSQRDSADHDGEDNSSSDDLEIPDYGRPASPREKEAVDALITAYYHDAATGDGARACRLIYSVAAENTVEEYFHVPIPHGHTCATTVSMLFAQHRQQMLADNRALSVTKVRVAGAKGLAMLNLRRTPEDHILIHREGRQWKLQSLFEDTMP